MLKIFQLVIPVTQTVQKTLQQKTLQQYVFHKINSNNGNPFLPLNFTEIIKGNRSSLYASANFYKKNTIEEQIKILKNLHHEFKINQMLLLAIELMPDAQNLLINYKEPNKLNIFNCINDQLVGLQDYTAPNIAQLEIVNNWINLTINHSESSIHLGCWGGIGRTGVYLAAYLMKHFKMNPDQAVNKLRLSYHNQAVETKEQKFILEEYYKYLNPFSKYTHANFEAHKTGAKIDPNIINGSLRINL